MDQLEKLSTSELLMRTNCACCTNILQTDSSEEIFEIQVHHKGLNVWTDVTLTKETATILRDELSEFLRWLDHLRTHQVDTLEVK